MKLSNGIGSVMSANINPNASIDTLFADDGPFETAATNGQIEVEIQKNALSTENKVDLLGKTVDSKGGIISSDTDIPPWVAIGFKSLKSNGKYRYVWLYKGKFSDPEDNNETKGDSINWQSDTITGNFVKLMYEYTSGGKTIRPWKYEMDEDDGAMSAWYVFASIGMYPLVVGEAVYELFPPLFDKVTLHLGADRKTTVVIRSKGSLGKKAKGKCKGVTWNGRWLSNYQISVNELKRGGELVFHY